MSDTRYRVKNMCKYNIGVKLVNGLDVMIASGSFQMMTADDIAYVESMCTVNRFFSKRMLIPYDSQGNEAPLDSMGIFVAEDQQVKLDEATIAASLKQSVKKMEAWLADIDDPAELHEIAMIAKSMDLPASKLRVLTAKMPNGDFIDPAVETE